MASSIKQWAALQLKHQLRQASTPEERAAVYRQIERAKIDPSYRRQLAEAGEHGQWSSGAAMTAKLGLAGASFIPGVNLVAGPALAALAIPTAMESYERAQSGLPWGWQAAESAADLLLPGIGRGGTSLLRGLKGSKAAKEAAEQAPRLVTDTGRVTGEGKKILRGQYQTGYPPQAGAASPLDRSVTALERAKARAAEKKGFDQALEEEFLSGTPLRRGTPYSRSISVPALTGSRTSPRFGHTVKSAKSRIPSVKDLDVPDVSTARLGKMRKSYEQAQLDAATRPTATGVRRGLSDVQAGFKTNLMRSLDDLQRGRPRRDIGVVQETDRLGRPLSGSKLGDWISPDLRKSKIGGTAGVRLSKLAQASGEYGDSPAGQAAWKQKLAARGMKTPQPSAAVRNIDPVTGLPTKTVKPDSWVRQTGGKGWVNLASNEVVTDAKIANKVAELRRANPTANQGALEIKARTELLTKPTKATGGKPVTAVVPPVVAPLVAKGTQEVAGVGTKLVDDATQSVVKPVVEGVEQAVETGASVLPKVVDEGRLPAEIESAIRFARTKIDKTGSRGPGEDAAMDYIQDVLLPNLSREQQNIFVQGTREGKLTGEASQLAKETISDLYRTTSGKAGGKPVTGMIGSQYKRLTQKMPKGRPSPDVQKKITATLDSVGSKEAAAAQETMSRFILMNPSIKKILDTGGKVTRKDLEKNKFSGLADYMKWNTDGTLDLTTNPKGGIRWLGNKVENVKNPQGQNTALRAALNVVQMNRISAMSKIIEQMVGRTLKGKKVPGGASGWAKKTFADPTAERADLHTGIFLDVLEKGLPATGTKGTGRFEAATAAIGDFEKELAMLLAMITGASALGGASLPSREI
jgi:hypothetical protein